MRTPVAIELQASILFGDVGLFQDVAVEIEKITVLGSLILFWRMAFK